MPEISRFFGIVVRMFMEAGAQHNTSYFHAYYQDEVAVFSIDEVKLLAGSFPKRQQRFVEAWGKLHKEELLKDWNLLQNGRLPFPIEP